MASPAPQVELAAQISALARLFRAKLPLLEEFTENRDCVLDDNQRLVVSQAQYCIQKLGNQMRDIVKIFSHVNSLYEQWNLLSSIGKLSPEILSLIFRHVTFHYPATLFKLAGVCRRWRYIVLETPSLWTTLDLLPNRVDCVDAMIKYSRDFPLSVVLDTTDIPPSRGEGPFELVLNEFRRIRHLEVRGFYLFCRFLEYAFPSPGFSVLQSLRIDALKQHKEQPMPNSRLISLLDLPNFHTLEVCGFETKLWHPMLRPTLRSLVLKAPLKTAAFPVEQWLAMLAQLPMLEVLDIDLPFGPAAPAIQRTSVVLLAHLRKLSLSGNATESLVYFFDHIQFPGHPSIVLKFDSLEGILADDIMDSIAAKLASETYWQDAPAVMSCQFGYCQQYVSLSVSRAEENTASSRIFRITLAGHQPEAILAAFTDVCQMISSSVWAPEVLILDAVGVLESVKICECYAALKAMTAVQELTVRPPTKDNVNALTASGDSPSDLLFPYLKSLTLHSPVTGQQVEVANALYYALESRLELGQPLEELLLHSRLQPENARWLEVVKGPVLRISS